jgi:hypothetical protein
MNNKKIKKLRKKPFPAPKSFTDGETEVRGDGIIGVGGWTEVRGRG